MASTRDLRRRIKSVKNTAQITKAMQMVAASKMRRAQQAAMAGRDYARLMNEMMAEVRAASSEISHPLMEAKDAEKRALIIVSSDKGLCGALVTNQLREASKTDASKTVYIAAGRKGSQFVARTKRELLAEFHYADTPEFSEARAISKFAQELFLDEKVSAVDILYMDYVSTLVQEPRVKQLLPVGEIQELGSDLSGSAGNETASEKKSQTDFLFEPSASEVLGNLLPHYLNYQVYQVLLEAKASEHSARMVAMKNATDNAKQLIKDLTLEFNKVRQANITTELLEITSAAMSM